MRGPATLWSTLAALFGINAGVSTEDLLRQKALLAARGPRYPLSGRRGGQLAYRRWKRRRASGK